MTRESFARLFAQILNPTRITFLRLADRLDILNQSVRIRESVRTAAGQDDRGLDAFLHTFLDPILSEGRATEADITRGADFIREDVLANATEETLDLFREADPTMFPFVLTKAIFIYAVGTRSKDEIPHFFKADTRAQIETLRKELTNKAVITELGQAITTPELFEKGPQSGAAKAAFTRLKKAGSNELQNSLFTTRCWQQAAAEESAPAPDEAAV